MPLTHTVNQRAEKHTNLLAKHQSYYFLQQKLTSRLDVLRVVPKTETMKLKHTYNWKRTFFLLCSFKIQKSPFCKLSSSSKFCVSYYACSIWTYTGFMHFIFLWLVQNAQWTIFLSKLWIFLRSFLPLHCTTFSFFQRISFKKFQMIYFVSSSFICLFYFLKRPLKNVKKWKGNGQRGSRNASFLPSQISETMSS